MNPRRSRGLNQSPVFCWLPVVRYKSGQPKVSYRLTGKWRLLVSDLLLRTNVAPDDVPYHDAPSSTLSNKDQSALVGLVVTTVKNKASAKTVQKLLFSGSSLLHVDMRGDLRQEEDSCSERQRLSRDTTEIARICATGVMATCVLMDTGLIELRLLFVSCYSRSGNISLLLEDKEAPSSTSGLTPACTLTLTWTLDPSTDPVPPA